MYTLNKNERGANVILRIAFLIAVVISLLAGGLPKAQAAVVYFDTDDTFVVPGETISVSIFSTVSADRIRMDRISDADFGIASYLYLNPDFFAIVSEGTAVNTDGILIEGIMTDIVPAWSDVWGVLYSFDYLVPMAPPGHTITIFADSSENTINEIFCDVGGNLVYVTPESLTLTVVPEPATMLLFGLGVLLLRKKR